MPVIDIQALLKPIINVRPHQRGPVVRGRLGDRVRQLPARADIAVQHVHQRVALLLAAQPRPDERDDVVVREDALEDDGADGVRDDDDGLAGGGLRDGRHKPVAVVPRVQRLPVAHVVLDGQILLAAVGRDEDDGGGGGGGGAGARGLVVGGRGDDGGARGLGARADGVDGGDEVLELASAA